MNIAKAVGRQAPGAQISSTSVGALFESMPVTSAHWRVGLVLFLVFVVESWEMMVLVLSGSSVAGELKLSSTELGSLIGAIFLGMIPGAFIWGYLADAWGRRKSVMISLAGYGVVSLASALSPNYPVLWGMRMLCGVTLAGVLVITYPYFEELLPVRVRGRAAVWLASGWPVGLLISVGVAYRFGDYGWRWPVAISSLAGLWALAVWRFVPESPYWLHRKGRTTEALAVIHGLSKAKIASTYQLTEAAVEENAASRELLRSPQRRRTLIQLTVNFCFSWGYWALTAWMPALLAKKGLSAPQGYGFIALSALFMFPGYATASFLTGRLGRKKVMLSFVALATVAGFGLASADSLLAMYGWNFALSFFSLGAWGVWNTWMGEIYDTRMRTIGYSWGIAAQRIANAIAPAFVGAVLASSGFSGTVASIACFLAATFVALLFLPETEGHILD